MALSFTASAGTSTLPPLGTYTGKLVRLEQMDPRPNAFAEGEQQVQVKFVIATDNVISVDHDDDEDVAADFAENSEEAWAYANAAAIDAEGVTHPIFGPRSTIRRWFEAILGRSIENDETVDESMIVGKAVMYTVELNTNNNPTIKNIKLYKQAKRRRRPAPQPEPDEFEGELVDEEDF